MAILFRFRHFACIALIFLGLETSSIHAQLPSQPPARLSAEITNVLTQQQAAWNSGDIPAFMQGYWRSPLLTFSGSNGVARGYDAVLARYQHSYPDKSAMGHLDFSALEVYPLGDSAALVLGKWYLKRDSGDVGGVFTLVFQHFSDGWKIIHDHTSQLAPQKP